MYNVPLGVGHPTLIIQHVNIMNIVSKRGLRKQQRQDVHSDLLPPFLPAVGIRLP